MTEKQDSRPMTNTISRSQAKAWTLGAQLGSLVCVLGGVALGIVGLPSPTPGSALDQTRNDTAVGINIPDGDPTGAQNQGDDAPQTIEIDTAGLAQRFALLDNAPVLVNNATPEPEPTITEDPTTDTDGSIVKRVRYIGFINDPEAKHAFIRIDGKQRIVSLGQVAKAGNEDFPDLSVERITPRSIVMSDGKKRAKIDLAVKIGQSITMAGGQKVDVAKAAQNGSMLTPEDEAKIAAMPPRQQSRARQRLERERRGLPPESTRKAQTPTITTRGSFNGGRANIRNSRNNRGVRDGGDQNN